ncbi:MAG: glycogen synthase GlgA [Atopobiaceae bacterium]|nr:glycogen synthase GlgA [Atopobiaceae bacterium]
MATRRKLKILLATSEAVPFAKTGGLGDVAGSLPQALNAEGAKCAVIMPKYSTIPWEYQEKMEHLGEMYVPLAWRSVYCGVEHLEYDGVDFYFLDNEAYFKRDTIYGHFDDGERFAFFSKAICEAIEFFPELQCDVCMCNDWQTALVPVFLREFYRESDACNNVKCVFTVHNVKFQGQFGDQLLDDILGVGHIPAAADQLRCDERSINFMKGALCYSDLLTTVSPTYAVELQMPFFGEGLDYMFRRRSSILSGILNGIDQNIWNPETDKFIEHHFSVEDMSGKKEAKRALQEECGLWQDENAPLVVMIGRLTNQKGLGLVRYAMDRIMSDGVQMIVLGTGDADQEEAFRYFQYRYPGQMCARITFDNALSHRMYAGGDILLMPSEFEPCGLSQMIAMRYGTLPVVRETGGLKDSVEPYNQFTGEGTGFSFANMNADEMADCLLTACWIYRDNKDAWRELQKHGMTTDFSWDRAAVDYLDLFHSLHPEVIPWNKR